MLVVGWGKVSRRDEQKLAAGIGEGFGDYALLAVDEGIALDADVGQDFAAIFFVECAVNQNRSGDGNRDFVGVGGKISGLNGGKGSGESGVGWGNCAEQVGCVFEPGIELAQRVCSGGDGAGFGSGAGGGIVG